MPSFMENLLGQAQTIKEKGMFFFPIETDHKAPTVATSDVAAVAAEFLIDSTWTRQADVPVLGPEDISPNEMAAILSKGLGRPVRYQQTNRSVQEQDGRLRHFGSLRIGLMRT